MSDLYSNPLLALVKERNLIDDLQMEEILQEQARSGKTVSQILQDFQLVDIDTQLQVTAEHLSTEVVNVTDLELTPELLKTIPAGTARMYQAIPVGLYGSLLQVALAEPLMLFLIAGFIGVIFIGMVIPIFSLQDHIK